MKEIAKRIAIMMPGFLFGDWLYFYFTGHSFIITGILGIDG